METAPGIEQDGTRNGKAYNHRHSPTSLWLVEGPLLDLDDADRRWASAATDLVADDERPQSESLTLPSDVVFLSRHVAKSGVPALCVHPIGIPNVSPAKPWCISGKWCLYLCRLMSLRSSEIFQPLSSIYVVASFFLKSASTPRRVYRSARPMAVSSLDEFSPYRVSSE